MSQIVQLTIPDEVARRARQIGAKNQHDLEEVLLDWLKHAADNLPVELLDDAEILALSEMQMQGDQADELSSLLTDNSEGKLDAAGHLRLDAVITIYRNGMLRKSEAVREAVARGLRTPLGRE